MPPDGKAHLGERLAVAVGAFSRACATRWRVVLPLSWALAVASGLLASRLTVQGAFQDLLPPDAVAVRHLKELERRTRVLADYMVGVECEDPSLSAKTERIIFLRYVASPGFDHHFGSILLGNFTGAVSRSRIH